jgi:hypothetical protein
MANYAPYPVLRFYDDNNNPLVGGKIYVYLAGTTTPTPTYQDVAGTTPNSNPVILDSRGEALVYLATNISYKFVLKTSAEVTIRTVDNITTIAQPSVAGNSLISAVDVPAQREILGIGNFANRNYIINGDFSVWQRATGFNLGTIGTYVYTADRWVCRFNSGIGVVNVSRYSIFGNGWNYLIGNKYACRIYNTNLTQLLTYELGTRIEGVDNLSGRTVTLSFYYFASLTTGCTVSVTQNYGTGGTPSSSVTTSGSTTLLYNSDINRATVTLTLPVAFGTRGTNGDDHLYVSIETSTGPGGSNVPNYYWGFQLEEGSSASAYEYVPYAVQLRNCQRYYWKPTSEYIGEPYSTSGISGCLEYPVEMRVAPTITNGSFSAGTFASSNVGTRTARLYNSASNWTIGTPITASAEFSAEL